MNDHPKVENYLLGIDLGTSSVKAGLLNLHTGDLEHLAAQHYEYYSEYDSTELWRKTSDVIHESVKHAGIGNEITSIGITGQMHGAVLYDADGNIIEPLINWRDKKRYSVPVQESLDQMIGSEAAQSTGSNIGSGFTGTVLFWIKQNDPVLFRNINHFVLFTDFVRAKLLGRNDYRTDQTNASSTGLFNTRLGEWHFDLIQRLDLPIRIFPQVHRASGVAGTLSEEIAEALNLKPGIPIIYGGGDNQMSMLGSGLISQSSPALINIGTGAQISKVISSYHTYPDLDTRPFFDGQYALVGASLGGGGHYGDFIQEINQTGVALGYSEVDKLALEAPAGSDGLQYCTGPSRTNPGRKKGFFGNMNQRQSIGHQARAIIEGILMDLYEFYGLMTQYDDGDTIIGSGKALINSPAWRQIASDLFGKRLRVVNTENAILGASIMAGRGVNYFRRPSDWEYIIKYEDGAMPDKTNVQSYKEHFIDQWKQQVAQLSSR